VESALGIWVEAFELSCNLHRGTERVLTEVNHPRDIARQNRDSLSSKSQVSINASRKGAAAAVTIDTLWSRAARTQKQPKS
jgi:hypothetical protein